MIVKYLASSLSFYCIFLLLGNFTFLQAKEIYLCNSGCPINTLKDAIDSASSGDTILIKKGVYQVGETIINKSIRLKGESKGQVILDGQNKRNVLVITSDHVTITNLIIRNSGNSEIEEFAGIRAENVTDCEITHNKILNATYGIYLARAMHCNISDNHIAGIAKRETLSGNGVHLWYSQNIDLHRNTITGHRDGLYFEFSNNLNINNNLSASNIRYGMHFMFSHNSSFRNNLFLTNYTGVAIMYSDKIIVENNIFYGGNDKIKTQAYLSSVSTLVPTQSNFLISTMGLLLKEINESKFSFNVIQENAEGIIIEGSVKNEFHHNEFNGNGLAIKIYGNCQENRFTRNNIINNFFDITTNTKENFNSFHYNYWSNYKGFDLNKDGFGDHLYRPVQVFSYLLTKYPEAIILFASPMMHFLETIERAFPVLNPVSIYDKKPLISLVEIHNNLPVSIKAK